MTRRRHEIQCIYGSAIVYPSVCAALAVLDRRGLVDLDMLAVCADHKNLITSARERDTLDRILECMLNDSDLATISRCDKYEFFVMSSH
jgi:hypothetical protein